LLTVILFLLRRKDIDELTTGDRVAIETEGGESIVTLTNLNYIDAGQYICCAENAKGKIESSAFLRCNGMCSVKYII